MPVDPTKPTRRVARKFTEGELKDIEFKRIRGEISCAECRRLKLRCDKKVPCSSCVRRGCESICPCGLLSAGQGTRFILADTDQLHHKISEMSHRIRQLEDALSILQAAISDQRHPLLSDDLVKIKFGSEVLQQHQNPGEVESTATQSIDALGTLTMSDAGEVKYFGRSAGSETLMVAEDEDLEEEDDDPNTTVAEQLDEFACPFPFTRKLASTHQTLDLLESCLPSKERALALCDSYLKLASNFFRPIKRDELLGTFLPSIYDLSKAKKRHGPPSSQSDDHIAEFSPSDAETTAGVQRNTSHGLATLYFIFALGALLDLSLPPYNAEAEGYYEMGCAALSQRVIFDSPQIDTVQALGLMATYHCLGGKKYSRNSAWCLMSFAAKVAQSIGLHRDSSRWNMHPKTVEKRRTLFWEVFAADLSHSLALGRPPAMSLPYIDCEFPIDEEATLSDIGEIQHGFWRMKYIFGRDMFLRVADATLTAKSPTYSTVLELDRKVREFSFPTSIKPFASKEEGEEQYFSSSLSLQGFYASQYSTVTMLYLHRSFFAQAMLDHPSNPLLSPFAPSFLTAYRCASVIIKASEHQFDRCAAMAMRVWFLLYHTFSAAIVVATVVIRSPNSNVATIALQDLGIALGLFGRAASQSHWARVALGILNKLKEKATRSSDQYTRKVKEAQMSIVTAPTALLACNTDSGLASSLPNTPALTTTSRSPVDEVDELAIFGGQTRVLARKQKYRRRSSVTPIMDRGSPSHPKVPGSQVASSLPSIQVNNESMVQPMALTDAHSIDKYDIPLRPAQLSGAYGSLDIPVPTDPILVSRESIASCSQPIPSGDVELPESATAPGFTRERWRGMSPDIDGLPKVDTSFGWAPPQRLSLPGLAGHISQPEPSSQPPQSLFRSPMSGSLPCDLGAPAQLEDHNQLGTFAFMDHPPQGPVGYLGASYDFSAGAQEGSTGASVIDHDGSDHAMMVELGLMTDSDVDLGWFSFVQDCGIIDGRSSGTIADAFGV